MRGMREENCEWEPRERKGKEGGKKGMVIGEERKIRRKRKRWKKRSLDTSGEMEEKSN